MKTAPPSGAYWRVSMIKLIKAFRTDENTVKVLYLHEELHYEFLVEWSNIHPETGKAINYALELDCLSRHENFNDRVIDAIREGESDSNPDVELYLAIRDTFDALDCEGCE